jgi:hypothetical protein
VKLRDHVFYHELLNGNCSLADAVKTFEKVIVGRRIASLPDLRKRAGELAREPSDRPETLEVYYGALVVETVFAQFGDAQVRDFINLVHKEAMARRVSTLLRADDVDLRQVERALREFSDLPIGESQVSPNIAIGIRVQLINSFISDNLFYLGVAKFHITMRDVDALLQRVVGKYGQGSRVGGKSAGMILANRILKPAFGEPTGFEDVIAEVESRYLTAQLFNRFIEYNKLEEGHGLKYLDAEEREQVREDLEVQFRRGAFPAEVVEEIEEALSDLGPGPLIVRSSSLLEDSMGFPFYGKYESVFISNQGSREERLAELMDAIKTVYVSILSGSVIEYRKDKFLLDYDDMMSVLIQQVVGKRYGKYFFPEMSGVAFSWNEYCWTSAIDPADGVARIVHGLGTRAVDRGGDDYPRLVPLGRPDLRPEASLKERLKYSQRYVDVLNLDTGQLESPHFVELYNAIRGEHTDQYVPRLAVSVVVDESLRRPGIFPASLETGGAAITFDGVITQTDFPALLRRVLKMLESAYGVPVDIEFACQDDKLYILQCRPLAHRTESGGPVRMPVPREDQTVLFDTGRDIFRSASVTDIRYIVYVDGRKYRLLREPADKLEVARTVGRINRSLRGERFVIAGPGRWGSVNLDLGVKAGYGDINNALVLIEIALDQAGYRPEVSYGTHFFQDLVEAEIIPLPLFPGDTGNLDGDFLDTAQNSLDAVLTPELRPGNPVAGAVKVIDLDAAGRGRLSVYLDASSIRGIGLIG